MALWHIEMIKGEKYKLVISQGGNWVIVDANASSEVIQKITNVFYFFERSGYNTENAEPMPIDDKPPGGAKYDPYGLCYNLSKWRQNENLWEHEIYVGDEGVEGRDSATS